MHYYTSLAYIKPQYFGNNTNSKAASKEDCTDGQETLTHNY